MRTGNALAETRARREASHGETFVSSRFSLSAAEYSKPAQLNNDQAASLHSLGKGATKMDFRRSHKLRIASLRGLMTGNFRRRALFGLGAVGLTLAVALGVMQAETPGALDPAARAQLTAPGLPDIVEGSADAPATIIEYASATCSHCAAFHHATWPALKAKYVDTGKAKFILREFPLDPLATAAFMLARCAGPAKRDAVLDRLFDSQSEWAFAANSLYKLKGQMRDSAMSEADFQACLANQELLNHVNAGREIAASRPQVRSTPTFFVNGVRLNGEVGLDKFDEILAPPPR